MAGSTKLMNRYFFRGCLKGLGIAFLIYGLVWIGFETSGTNDLVPGALHTACMLIYGFSYVISQGVVANLRSRSRRIDHAKL